MLAAWYERPGPAAEVLQVGEMADPDPGPGEVRVRVTVVGHQPGRHEEARRLGRLRDAVSARDPAQRRRGRRSTRSATGSTAPGSASACGSTARSRTARSARPRNSRWCPPIRRSRCRTRSSDEVGACLGIPGITAHRAVFGDGPVAGMTVLVHGVLGGVGSMAAQLAAWGGATRDRHGAAQQRPRAGRRRGRAWRGAGRGRPRVGDPRAGARRRAPHHRGVVLGQRRPRRRGRRARRR